MGRRAGTKRSDKRWIADDGVVWASKLECEVYNALKGDERIVVRKCEKGEGDTFSYTTPVRSATCLSCGGTESVQNRTYTPDLFVYPRCDGGDKRGYYLEVKGNFPGQQRNLLRGFLKTGPEIGLRLVLAGAHRNATSKLTMFEYCVKYMKIPVHAWDGQLQGSWYE